MLPQEPAGVVAGPGRLFRYGHAYGNPAYSYYQEVEGRRILFRRVLRQFPSIFSLLDEGGFSITSSYLNSFPWRGSLLRDELRKLHQRMDEPVLARNLALFQMPSGEEKQYDCISKVAMSTLGFDSAPRLHLVHCMPEPFDTQAWDGMCADSGDEKKLGIAPGIYFRREFVTHPYFEFIIAHELVHWAISAHSKKYSPHASVIEEGLSDALGLYILLKSKCAPVRAVTNLLIYNRAAIQPSDLWSTYWQFCKTTLGRASIVGFERLVELVGTGREALVDVSLLSGSSDNGSATLEQDWKDALECAMIADGVKIIDIDAFILLEEAISLKQLEFLEIGKLKACTEMPEQNFHSAIDALIKSGLLVQPDSHHVFQPFVKVPSNLRYAL